jgi:hypothetical protein
LLVWIFAWTAKNGKVGLELILFGVFEALKSVLVDISLRVVALDDREGSIALSQAGESRIGCALEQRTAVFRCS